MLIDVLRYQHHWVQSEQLLREVMQDVDSLVSIDADNRRWQELRLSMLISGIQLAVAQNDKERALQLGNGLAQAMHVSADKNSLVFLEARLLLAIVKDDPVQGATTAQQVIVALNEMPGKGADPDTVVLRYRAFTELTELDSTWRHQFTDQLASGLMHPDLAVVDQASPP